jgi:hypothetical protein
MRRGDWATGRRGDKAKSLSADFTDFGRLSAFGRTAQTPSFHWREAPFGVARPSAIASLQFSPADAGRLSVSPRCSGTFNTERRKGKGADDRPPGLSTRQGNASCHSRPRSGLGASSGEWRRMHSSSPRRRGSKLTLWLRLRRKWVPAFAGTTSAAQNPHPYSLSQRERETRKGEQHARPSLECPFPSTSYFVPRTSYFPHAPLLARSTGYGARSAGKGRARCPPHPFVFRFSLWVSTLLVSSSSSGSPFPSRGGRSRSP